MLTSSLIKYSYSNVLQIQRYLFHNREQLEQNYDYFNRIEEKGMNSFDHQIQ